MSSPTITEDLVRDRITVSCNPRNIGAVAGEPESHPIIMADNLDNDHNSDLENRTPHKNTEVTLDDTFQPNKDKNPPNTGAMEALQDRLKQIEKEVEYQREAERDLWREARRS